MAANILWVFRWAVDGPKKYGTEKANIIKLLADYILKRMSRRLMWQAIKALMLLKFIRMDKVKKVSSIPTVKN